MDARTIELQASGTKQMEDHYTQSIKWIMAPLPFHIVSDRISWDNGG